ncbi:MAG: hypothetical protein WAV13_02420 [Thermodesulfovibrionales bacterium]
MVIRTSKGRYCSRQKASALTFPFFNSVLTHFIILSFILTMPLNSGSFTVNSIESLLLNFGNDEEEQGSPYDRNLLKEGIMDPGQGKKEDLRLADEGPGENIRSAADEAVSAIEEMTAAPRPENAAGEKVNKEIPSPDLVSVQEMSHEKTSVPESPKSQIDQMKTIAIEDVQGKGKIDETTKVIAGERPAKAIIASPAKASPDTIKPATKPLIPETQGEVAEKAVIKSDIVLPAEKPAVDNPLRSEPVSVETPVRGPSLTPFSKEETDRTAFGAEVKNLAVKEIPSRITPGKDNDKAVVAGGKKEVKFESPVPNTADYKTKDKRSLSGKEARGQSKKIINAGLGDTRTKGQVMDSGTAQIREKGYKSEVKASELSGEKPGEVVPRQASFEGLALPAKTAAEYGPDTTENIKKGTQSEIKTVFAQQVDARKAEEHAGTMEDAKTAKNNNGERMGVRLPIAEELILKDIKIEVALEGEDARFLSISLLKRPYPRPEQKIRKNKQENISCAVERKVEDAGAGSRQTLSVVKAEKGIYTLVIDNKGTEGRNAAIVFNLYEGQKGKRTKEYKTVRIQPGSAAKIKFILPDALFWDDEDRFSGEIENSISTTKFNESGVVWREEKD